MDLKNKKCIPCSGKEPKLTPDEIIKYMDQVKDWELQKDPDKIVKEFEFENFTNAVNFVNKVAEIATEQAHHPDICIHDYKMVKLELWTHKISGLHENDFILAANIDEL